MNDIERATISELFRNDDYVKGRLLSAKLRYEPTLQTGYGRTIDELSDEQVMDIIAEVNQLSPYVKDNRLMLKS